MKTAPDITYVMHVHSNSQYCPICKHVVYQTVFMCEHILNIKIKKFTVILFSCKAIENGKGKSTVKAALELGMHRTLILPDIHYSAHLKAEFRISGRISGYLTYP